MALDKTKIEELLRTDMFKELGLESISYEERVELLDQMGKVVLEGIWVRILENLSDNDKIELEKLTDGVVASEELITFLKGKIPNFEDIVKEEIASYKSIILDK